MNEGIVIVRSRTGFDVRNDGRVVGSTTTHSEADAFARGFSAGIFDATGVIVSVEDHTDADERVTAS